MQSQNWYPLATPADYVATPLVALHKVAVDWRSMGNELGSNRMRGDLSHAAHSLRYLAYEAHLAFIQRRLCRKPRDGIHDISPFKLFVQPTSGNKQSNH